MVVTFMTGDPPAGDLSPFAQFQHTSWELPAQEAYAVRRGEDAAALQLLGADFCHIGFMDCVYRRSQAGFCYVTEESLFGPVHPDDELRVKELAGRLDGMGSLSPGVSVFSPLAVGNHVDHQLVRRAAELWCRSRLLYYEDFPYSDGASTPAEAGAASPRIVPLSEADVEAKVAAIGRYRSQVEVLFGGYVELEASVRAYGRLASGEEGWAERFWCPK